MNCKERLTKKYNDFYVVKNSISSRAGCGVLCTDVNGDCNRCPLQKAFNKLGEFEDKLENGTLIEVPCKVGGTVFVTPNGKDFYKAKLYGKNENGTYFVEVYATFTGIPLDKPFYDWHINTYTKEEAEARLKELKENARNKTD